MGLLAYEREAKVVMKSYKKSKAKRKGRYETILCIVGIFLIIVILIQIREIGNYLSDGRKSKVFSKDLRNSVTIMDEREQDMEANVRIKIPIAIDFDRLYKISGDTVAWLFAPGTRINYVIAQGSDNDYYLNHLLDGTVANGGTLFVDCRCNADFTNWNTIIYGHHMKNGTMFAGLMDYQDPDYYEEHPVMYLYVPGKRYKLELIAGYTTDIYDMVFSIPITKEERGEIIAHAASVSSFISGVTVSEEDKLVTLSTCSYAYEDARYVVIGRILEE